MVFEMLLLDYTNRYSSLDDSVQIPPHDVFDRNSTGLVTCGLMGKRKKKSNSVDVISSFINKIYKKKYNCLHHSRPSSPLNKCEKKIGLPA